MRLLLKPLTIGIKYYWQNRVEKKITWTAWHCWHFELLWSSCMCIWVNVFSRLYKSALVGTKTGILLLSTRHYCNQPTQKDFILLNRKTCAKKIIMDLSKGMKEKMRAKVKTRPYHSKATSASEKKVSSVKFNKLFFKRIKDFHLWKIASDSCRSSVLMGGCCCCKNAMHWR